MAALRTLVFFALLVGSAFPAAQAQRGLILGTEDLPELIDAGDDVSYDPTYPGAQDHDYLDLTAAWLSHDPDAGVVFLNLKVADASMLAETGTAGWVIQCQFGADMFAEGMRTGRLLYYWTKDHQASEVRSGVDWTPSETGNVNVGDTRPDVKHTFASKLAEPGYFVFGITQQQLLLFGDELSNMSATCYEVFDPTTEVGFLFNNGDSGSSEGSYSVKELRQTKRHDGSFDPIERLPTETVAPSTDESETGSTPGVGAAIVLALVAVLPLARRRV